MIARTSRLDPRDADVLDAVTTAKTGYA